MSFFLTGIGIIFVNSCEPKRRIRFAKHNGLNGMRYWNFDLLGMFNYQCNQMFQTHQSSSLIYSLFKINISSNYCICLSDPVMERVPRFQSPYEFLRRV